MNIDTVLKAMQDFEKTEEHEKTNKHMAHVRNLKNKYIQKLANMSKQERDILFTKIRDKYESDEYYQKEIKAGYEPRTLLYDVIFDYATEYGKASQYDINEYFPEEQYEIDGQWIVGMIHGQGSFAYFKKIQKDDIIPHVFEDVIKIYNSHDELIFETSNFFEYNDIIYQINEKNLKGYYIKMNGTKFDLNTINQIIEDTTEKYFKRN